MKKTITIEPDIRDVQLFDEVLKDNAILNKQLSRPWTNIWTYEGDVDDIEYMIVELLEVIPKGVDYVIDYAKEQPSR